MRTKQHPTRNPRLLRITTVPMSLNLLLRGQPEFFMQEGFEIMTASSHDPAHPIPAHIPHTVINLTRTISPIKDLRALRQTIRLIRFFKPDIVHTHTPKAGLIGMLAAWICKVPVRMHTVAGLPVMEASGMRKRILLFTEIITIFCAHKVYPNSFGLLHYMEKQFPWLRHKMKVLGKGSTNGIDLGYFSKEALLHNDTFTQALQSQHPVQNVTEAANAIRAQFGIQEQDYLFLFIGRLTGAKGINELVRAFERLSRRLNQQISATEGVSTTEDQSANYQTSASEHTITHKRKIKLLLAGNEEPELDPLDEYVRETMKHHPDILLPGFVKDVRPCLFIADSFVFPSYREGFPNVVMQAQAMQVPCIVTNINGCNELVTDKESGLIIHSKNERQLESAMEWMLSHPEEAKVMAEKAHQNIYQFYSQHQVWQMLLEEYKERLGE